MPPRCLLSFKFPNVSQMLPELLLNGSRKFCLGFRAGVISIYVYLPFSVHACARYTEPRTFVGDVVDGLRVRRREGKGEGKREREKGK